MWNVFKILWKSYFVFLVVCEAFNYQNRHLRFFFAFSHNPFHILNDPSLLPAFAQAPAK